VLADLEAKKPLKVGPNDYVGFIPPSRSHETDLIMKLYGGTPIPEGFDLMTEVITRLKSGKLSFMPGEKSGWVRSSALVLGAARPPGHDA